jgi:hypothetical protein
LKFQGSALKSSREQALKSLTNLLSLLLPPLWCAGKLGNCPKDLTRFRFTCFGCRWRRRFYGKFEYPPFWINYTYKSFFHEQFVDSYIHDNKEYSARDGGKLRLTTWDTLHIDPRGHFTALRCAIIIVLDSLMGATKIKKPLVEFCEFFSSYPTF